jgi:hypothetical protein
MVYGFLAPGLRETIPAALDSVSTASIHLYYLKCMRILDTYAAEFRERVQKTPRHHPPLETIFF